MFLSYFGNPSCTKIWFPGLACSEAITDNVKNNGNVIKTEQTADVESCQSLCRNTEGCSGWNWQIKKESCELLDGIERSKTNDKFKSGICSGKTFRITFALKCA